MLYTDLTDSSISDACEALETYLQSQNLEPRHTMRLVLIMEESLLFYQSRLGNDRSFQLHCGKRWGQSGFTLTLSGESYDPFSIEEEDTAFILRNLKNNLDLSPSWNHRNGRNIISYTLPKKQNAIARLMIAVIAGCVMGVLGVFVPEGVSSVVVTIITPLFSTFVGLLSAISGPMVFLSVTWSICGIGDMSTLGKIGSVVSKRFIATTFGLLALDSFMPLSIFPLTYSDNSNMGDGLMSVYEMILNIIPSNLASPFVDNNLLQIIFMSVVFGIAILILSKKLKVLPNFISESNVVIMQVMKWITMLLPAFVFISLWRLFWTSDLQVLKSYAKPILVFLAGLFLFAIIYVLAVCLTYKLSVKSFIKTLLPAYLIAVTTASSSAAYSTTMEISEKQLGIDPKITAFGVPLGQVIYMPSCGYFFFVVSLAAASMYNQAITPTWLVMCFIISGVLSIATPPIPNGSTVCLGILFVQMGIPEEAMAMGVILNALTTNMSVSTNLICRQCELLLSAGKLGMVDESKLQASCGKVATH